ncbi:MAG: four helix bundle protein [Gammaproteobacteria bacterium]|jgi:four helix bundle protein|nr:four helix bundle protein [Gammaproteobacteria bacterium]
MDALDSHSSSPLASLGIWNRACSLAVRSYSLIHDCDDAVFRERVTSASLSLAAHIAAGYERATLGQFANFLERARGNCAELRTQLYLAAQLDLIPVTRSTELMQESVEISRQLQSLITWCDAQPDASPRAHRAWRQVAE